MSAYRFPPSSVRADSSLIPSLHSSKASYDNFVRAITLTVIIGLIALMGFISYLAYIEGGTRGLAVLVITVIIIASVIVIPYLYSPREFIITTRGVLVKRLLKSFLIPMEDIAVVKKFSWTRRGIRLWASGGLYGFFGLFKISGLGRVWMYVTNRRNTILIETRRGVKYIISPDDPQAFMEKLRSLGVKVELQA